MERLLGKNQQYFYENESAQIIHGDSFKVLAKLRPESIDMIFADPPYFLSNNGISCKGGRMVSVNKGDWDKIGDESTQIVDKHKFNRKWIRLCKRVLSPNGSIWISGTMHNIYSIGMALEQEGFKIINNITWQKQIHHLILLVNVLLILQKPYYGHRKQTRRHDIILIMN